jgi:hypothetical protein
VSWVTGKINWIKDKFSLGFLFGSPSRVFMDYGRWISEGLAIGMEKGFGDVEVQTDIMQRAIMPNKPNTVTYGGGGARTVNFNGNLEFPNITSGSDAEEFVSNLEALAGSN